MYLKALQFNEKIRAWNEILRRSKIVIQLFELVFIGIGWNDNCNPKKYFKLSKK